MPSSTKAFEELVEKLEKEAEGKNVNNTGSGRTSKVAKFVQAGLLLQNEL